MKNLALSLVLITGTALGVAVISAPTAAEAGGGTYHFGYPPAFFAPAYQRRTIYAPAFPPHADYARAYYDDFHYRGIISAPYYGWQIRWTPAN
jgi:hypothetical protein